MKRISERVMSRSPNTDRDAEGPVNRSGMGRSRPRRGGLAGPRPASKRARARGSGSVERRYARRSTTPEGGKGECESKPIRLDATSSGLRSHSRGCASSNPRPCGSRPRLDAALATARDRADSRQKHVRVCAASTARPEDFRNCARKSLMAFLASREADRVRVCESDGLRDHARILARRTRRSAAPSSSAGPAALRAQPIDRRQPSGGRRSSRAGPRAPKSRRSQKTGSRPNRVRAGRGVVKVQAEPRFRSPPPRSSRSVRSSPGVPTVTTSAAATRAGNGASTRTEGRLTPNHGRHRHPEGLDLVSPPMLY